MRTITFLTATVTINYPASGGYDLTFINHVTDAREARHYKTLSAAKAATTKFFNRMARIYNWF